MLPQITVSKVDNYQMLWWNAKYAPNTLSLEKCLGCCKQTRPENESATIDNVYDLHKLTVAIKWLTNNRNNLFNTPLSKWVMINYFWQPNRSASWSSDRAHLRCALLDHEWRCKADKSQEYQNERGEKMSTTDNRSPPQSSSLSVGFVLLPEKSRLLSLYCTLKRGSLAYWCRRVLGVFPSVASFCCFRVPECMKLV